MVMDQVARPSLRRLVLADATLDVGRDGVAGTALVTDGFANTECRAGRAEAFSRGETQGLKTLVGMGAVMADGPPGHAAKRECALVSAGLPGAARDRCVRRARTDEFWLGRRS
jgi:hypothetical protein